MTRDLGAGWVDSLWTYPIKGLSGQRHDRVPVVEGRGFPRDRRWALARKDGAYRADVDQALRKTQFHALVRDGRLAGVRTTLDQRDRLTVSVQEHVVLDAVDLTDPAGQEVVSAFFGRVLDLPRSMFPVIARQPGRRFTDVAPDSEEMMHAVSLINLASVRDLADRVGVASVDPLRFRANVYVDGLPPLGELDMVGESLQVGDVTFEVVEKTGRCAATSINPADARNDLAVPRLLVQHYGHSKMGCYLVARGSGELTVGAPVVASRAPTSSGSRR